MLKKWVLGSLVTVMGTSSVLAHGHFKSGFLAGAHVGYSWGSGRFNGAHDHGIPALTPTVTTASASARKSGPLFGIFGGYRHVAAQGYTLGLNLEANIFGSNELSKDLLHSAVGIGGPVSDLFQNRLKRTFNIVPTLVIGKVFSDCYHVSLGLGLAFARFKQQISALDPDLNVPATSAQRTKVGFVPSLGIEYAVAKNVSLTGNFSYEIYSKVSRTFVINEPVVEATYASSIKPRYATLKIGAVYRF